MAGRRCGRGGRLRPCFLGPVEGPPSLTGGGRAYFTIRLLLWLGFLGGVGWVGVGVDVDVVGLEGREREEKGVYCKAGGFIFQN